MTKAEKQFEQVMTDVIRPMVAVKQVKVVSTLPEYDGIAWEVKFDSTNDTAYDLHEKVEKYCNAKYWHGQVDLKAPRRSPWKVDTLCIFFCTAPGRC